MPTTATFPRMLRLWRTRGSSCRMLPLARSNDQRVRYPPSPGQRQLQSGQLHDELCRRTPVEVEGIDAPEPTLVGRVGQEARERRRLDLRRHHERDDTALGTDRGALGDLRLE